MTRETKRRRQRKERRIPEFASRAQEANFWDTHDIADYSTGLTRVRARFSKNLSAGITIRLDPRTLRQLRSQARDKGIGPTTLARMWILEHLRETTMHRSPRTAP